MERPRHLQPTPSQQTAAGERACGGRGGHGDRLAPAPPWGGQSEGRAAAAATGFARADLLACYLGQGRAPRAVAQAQDGLQGVSACGAAGGALPQPEHVQVAAQPVSEEAGREGGPGLPGGARGGAGRLRSCPEPFRRRHALWRVDPSARAAAVHLAGFVGALLCELDVSSCRRLQAPQLSRGLIGDVGHAHQPADGGRVPAHARVPVADAASDAAGEPQGRVAPLRHVPARSTSASPSRSCSTPEGMPCCWVAWCRASALAYSSRCDSCSGP